MKRGHAVKSRIVDLVAQIIGEQAWTNGTGPSHLIDDLAMTPVQLFRLYLLIETELDIKIDFTGFRKRHLTSLDSLCECVSQSASTPLLTTERAVRELGVSALAALQHKALEEATSLCQQMFEIEPGCCMAYCISSYIRNPGPSYLTVLSWLHRLLKPATYVEIGVAAGSSMACAARETRCIGIDPNPAPDPELVAETRVYRMTSNEFFRHHDLRKVLNGCDVNLGFIDGLHLYENVLDDFINLERHCSRDAALLLHDCLPLDEATASRTQSTAFWTGDVWRILPVLARFRPDLSISAVKCAPSGLVIVRNLDPTSNELRKAKDEALAFGFSLGYSQIPAPQDLGIEVIANDWSGISRAFG
jgi:hypothetical protein